MKINRQLLNEAVKENIITGVQADNLWGFFKKHLEDIPSFNVTHLLYYFGGLIAITAMTLFITVGWERLGGFGIMVTSLIYMIIGILATNLLFRRHLPIPGGITATFVIALTPLAIYGFQKGMGFWPQQYTYQDYHILIQGLWIMMELGTLAVGAIVFYFYRQPFLLLPIAVTLWYMSMDLTPLLFQNENPAIYWHYKKLVSIFIGFFMILLALMIDFKTKSKKDYAFHLYLFGLLAFWGGITSLNSNSEWSKLIYCAFNIVLIFVGVLLSRRVFSVFGALGVLFYLGHLSYNVFNDSILFPFVLSLIGFAILYLGILWHKYEAILNQKVQAHLPSILRDLNEKR